jgi:signal transduction histidine kinase
MGDELAVRDGFRTSLAIPLLRDGRTIGVIGIRRREVRPFTEKQIALLMTFADQVVIAINNVGLFEEVQARNRELSEALEQQTATSTILRTIAASPTDIQPVLDAVAESAARLCEAHDALIAMKDGESLVFQAHYGPIAGATDSLPIDRDTVTGRAMLEGRPIQVDDILQAAEEYPGSHAIAVREGQRTMLAVPLLRETDAIGAMLIRRLEARPFSQKQIDLLTTFATQAVIAIENVRLFEEVQARNRELRVALNQQTATSDLLKVIGRSAFDLQPVFDALAESAVRLCEAERAFVFRFDGELLRAVAWHNPSPELVAFVTANPIGLGRQSIAARAGLERRTIHIRDVQADPEFAYATRDIDPIHTILAVPMLRGEELLGVIVIYRVEVRPFDESHIALMETFADQAVIAIENARLFDEVQTRNRELSEALEQQTATSTILRAIAASPTDIDPVLKAVAESAAKLCDALDATIFLKREDQLVLSAAHGELPNDLGIFPIDRGWVPGRAVVDRVPVHVPDLSLAGDEFPLGKAFAERLKHRSILAVPLLREDGPIGAIGVRRAEARPFTNQQIALLTTFADQGVIAIENVRLFDEVQARTRELARSVEELEALGEVSQAVNSTLDLKTVLETIVAKAVQLSDTDAGAIYVYSKSAGRFRLRATYGMSAELIAAISRQTIGLNDPGIGEAARLREPVQVSDLADGVITDLQKIVLDAGFRGVLVVPLLRPDKIVGALVVRRRTPGRFSDATVHLMETFAAQSVLAIQNARLFSEIEEKGRQLEIASRHKSQFLANMSHELRTPLNSVLGFTEMLADGLYGELPEKAKATLARIESNGKHLLGLINDVLDLSKIEAGQLQLSIDDYSAGQIVKAAAAAAEPLARAKGLTLTTRIADGLPLGRGDERRLTQVLINLAGNAVKFTDSGSVEITALAAGGRFDISVRDTGPGIAPEHQARIFEEFQQVDDSNTRKKGGTGLGLAISKRIIEMHGGRIGVQSAPGVGSTFWISIPIRAAERTEAA